MAPNNTLTSWGNEKTMNLNSLILTNIQSSPYFKVNLYELKTYHEVIDEIYYKVTHLEPWEKGSRKTAGQTGMCGGVRGVGAGGIVSSAYCLLYKLFTLKLTRKQLKGLIEHTDSPYIRGLGFMYIRYSQDPKELWDWYEPYLEDDEEIDVKAGGGHVMLIGDMLRQWLTKLEWYCTLFPRIPVPVQKDLDIKFKEWHAQRAPAPVQAPPPRHITDDEVNFGEAEKYASNAATRGRSPTPPHRARHSPPKRSPVPRHRSSPSRHRSPRRSPPRHRHSPSRHRRSKSPRRGNSPMDFARELQREKDRQNRQQEKSKRVSPSRSNEIKRSRSRERSNKINRSRSRERSSKHRSKSRERSSKHRSRSRERTSKHRSRSRERSHKHSSKSHEMSSKHRSSSHTKEHKKHKDKHHSKSRDKNGSL